jgi:hypothetical protein
VIYQDADKATATKQSVVLYNRIYSPVMIRSTA